MCYTVLRQGREPLEVRLNLPGLHNVRNSLAAIAIATMVDVPDDKNSICFGKLHRCRKTLLAVMVKLLCRPADHLP